VGAAVGGLSSRACRGSRERAAGRGGAAAVARAGRGGTGEGAASPIGGGGGGR